MNYSEINKCSVAESPGISVVLFVSGCLPNKCKEGNCPGCHNKDAQKFSYGREYTLETKQEILDAVNKPYIRHFVLCGGEPYDQNSEVLVDLLESIEKPVWCYTGYEFDEIKEHPLTKYLSVLVCGRFDITQRDISSDNPWRGSRNQRVVLVKESLETGKPVPMPGIPNNEI
jgi:anaerobic ribonucleoside-triphosphate reductase activating protein